MSLQHSAQNQLRQYIEQVERLEDEKKALAEDIKQKFLEAKSTGFDPKIMRKVLKIRKKSQTEIAEEESILEVYLAAMGMKGTPLGEYMDREPQAALEAPA